MVLQLKYINLGLSINIPSTNGLKNAPTAPSAPKYKTREEVVQELMSQGKITDPSQAVALSSPVTVNGRTFQALISPLGTLPGPGGVRVPIINDQQANSYAMSLLKEYNLTAPKLFESLLVLLARIESSSLLKTHVKKIVSLVMDDKFSLVRKVMKQASLAELKEYLLLSTKCQSFSDHELKIFQSLAEVADPRLAKTVKKQSLGDNPDIIWCTQEGFHRMQKRIQHIATVETVENAKEIEVARAHGDLRENAEFKAALERRDRLQQEMKTLSDQMGHARVISKDDINTDEVGIGCVIECLGDKGHKVIYKILGPWEADPDQQILSYQSKLAQTMGGKVKGEGFKFHDEDLVITDIRSYLE
jgi:transcription elongation GreA/GreB family factor